MESDEFDDDLADEDFLAVLDQTNSSARSLPGDVQQQAVSSASAEINLDDWPSDGFSPPDPATSKPVPPQAAGTLSTKPSARTGLNRVNSGSFRQTTLWGGEVNSLSLSQSQTSGNRVYRADRVREEPSHHELDKEAMETWVYPTNLGAIRDYQFSIVKNSLFNNTLVALPTGLGKTFIAATVMLNFHRWTKSAKIVFVAPTKPLVSQQVGACYSIAGIPRSETTLLTGDIPPALRVDEWESKRVFFMTPQTLMNDLSHGYADPKKIALLVVDEAHRAVGEYAYAKVTKLIRRFSKSIRVLALTATPGSKLETVQEVIDNLGISHCEIRTEESIDIRQYVHQRNIEQVVLDPSDEMNLISDLFTRALKPLVDKLSSQNIWYGRNPMALTAYGLLQAQKEWFATRGRQANQGIQFMMRAIFSVLTSIAHSIKLLNFHGIKPFYDNMVDMRSEQEGRGEKGSKYKRQLIEDDNFQEMMDKVSRWLKTDGFVGHPKLTALADCVLNHFMDNGETTRVIVFSEYRDSAEDIVRTLNAHKPLVKASVFVGQADGKRGEGMKQAQQIQTIERFKQGEFNVLVATSIGEEGLDIGQVDLIVCYDASASPIRMLQRMGRTGRKRAGNIVLLLMRGKEEEQFAKSKDNYAQMQKLICEGSRFNFRFDLSTRIVPREIRPQVDKRHIEIPFENTQDTSLPEPKKRRVPPGKKKPPKKFHMPDGVETGFQKVTDMLKPKNKSSASAKPKQRRNPELDDLAEVPALNKVVLSEADLKELDRSYRDLPFNHSVVEETDMPSMTSFPDLQRQLRPVVGLKHGQYTKRCVRLFGALGAVSDELVRPCREEDSSNYLGIDVPAFVDSDGHIDEDVAPSPVKQKVKSTQQNNRQIRGARSKNMSGTKRKSKVTSRGPKPATFIATGHDFEAAEGSDETEDENEDEDESDGATPVQRNRERRKGRAQRRGGMGINSDEIGDDCERDSDLLNSGDSDDGEDLVDFVVSDNHFTSSMQNPPSTSPTSTDQLSPVARPAQKPYFVPTDFPATQESDGMPDVDVLTSSRKRKSQAGLGYDSEVEVSSKRAPTRGRRAIVDSDSDE